MSASFMQKMPPWRHYGESLLHLFYLFLYFEHAVVLHFELYQFVSLFQSFIVAQVEII